MQYKWLVSDQCSEQVEHCSLRDTPWSAGQSIHQCHPHSEVGEGYATDTEQSDKNVRVSRIYLVRWIISIHKRNDFKRAVTSIATLKIICLFEQHCKKIVWTSELQLTMWAVRVSGAKAAAKAGANQSGTAVQG